VRRHGAAKLHDALRDEKVTKSELQRHMLGLIRRVGLPEPRTEAYVQGYTVDFLWPGQRVIVETDGHGAHGTRRRFETDRARDAHLTACGDRVLRFTLAPADARARDRRGATRGGACRRRLGVGAQGALGQQPGEHEAGQGERDDRHERPVQ
jgi:very-short-patch-repair endonuclease